MRRLPADLITAGLILVVAAVLGVTLIWSYGPQTDAAGQATHHLSMAEQWFITDTHLGHPFMATFRGFPSIEAHDAAIDHAVRKSVRDGDHLFVLGDVAMGGRAHGLAMIADWPGIKHLIAGNHDRCVDEDSEALTDKGWKRLSEIEPEDRFATINTDTYTFEWQQPSSIFVAEHDGPMWHFETQTVDHLVSANHDLFLGSHGYPFRKRKAHTFRDGQNVQNLSFMVSATPDWTRESPSSIRVPDASIGKQTGFDIAMDVAAPLFGWYVAEGSSSEGQGGASSCRVTFSQSEAANSEHYETICDLLDQVGVSYTRTPKAIRVNNRPLSEFLSASFGERSQTKRLPSWIGDLSVEHFESFLAAYFAGDGTRDKRSPDFETYVARTSSQQLADDMQATAIQYGWLVRIGGWRDFPVAGTEYVGRALTYSFRRRSRATLGRVKIVPYKGLIWCPTLPNGVWLVRRNGKALWTGNCHPMNGNSHMHQREYLAAFDSVQTGGMIKRDGMRILLSHFPYDGEGDMRAEHDDRAGQWRLRDEGNPLIHGHVHDSTRVRLSKNGTTMIHAGLDAWDFKPVTIHTLLSEAGLT